MSASTRDEVEAFRHARDAVLARIAAAAARAGRDPAGVTLVAVSKTVPATRVRAAVAAGLDVLGENRVQEAEEKVARRVDGAAWHLVGPLQSNKARRALELFDVIQSRPLGRARARASTRSRRRAAAGPAASRCCSRSTSTATPRRPASTPTRSRPRSRRSTACAALDVRGLMTIGRLVDDPEAARPTFAALRELSARSAARWPGLGPGAVDGHVRRLRGGGGGGGDDRPRRSGAVRRAIREVIDSGRGLVRTTSARPWHCCGCWSWGGSTSAGRPTGQWRVVSRFRVR